MESIQCIISNLIDYKMLRRLLDFQLSFFDRTKPLKRMRPFVSALDAFCYEAPATTKCAPFVRDAVDTKRWMLLVVLSLIPVIVMAIWNTGLQKMVYESVSSQMMKEYLFASTSFKGYFTCNYSDTTTTLIVSELKNSNY